MPTILVVDDSVVDCRLAGGFLEKNPDMTVVYASNGKEALKQLELHIPDLVVTDLQMPEMNGLELVEHVKKEYPLTPVILMTSQGSEGIAVQALQLGAASYVPKSNLGQDLPETVERVLAAAGKQRSQKQLMNRMMNSECDFVLENDLPIIFSLVNYLRQQVRCMRYCSETDHLRVSIALEEALMNAYFHGNLELGSELREKDYKAYYELARQRAQEPPYRDRRIHVRARLSQTEAIFVIRDEGPGFDPGELPDPRDPNNLDRICGRGVLLMRTFMEEVTFNETGNEVTMVKRRASRSADET